MADPNIAIILERIRNLPLGLSLSFGSDPSSAASKQALEWLVEHITRHEGLRLEAYEDAAGVLTIGYGHTKDVKKGQTISQEDAIGFLLGDLAEAKELAVNTLGKPIFDRLTPKQQAVITDMFFNVALAALDATKVADPKPDARASKLISGLRDGKFASAAREMLDFVLDVQGHKLDALARRRREVHAVYMSDKPVDDPLVATRADETKGKPPHKSVLLDVHGGTAQISGKANHGLAAKISP